MSEQVKQIWSADTSAVDKALLGIARRLDQVEAAQQRVNAAGRRGAEEMRRQAQSYGGFAQPPAGNAWASAYVQDQRLAVQAANPWISAARPTPYGPHLPLPGEAPLGRPRRALPPGNLLPPALDAPWEKLTGLMSGVGTQLTALAVSYAAIRMATQAYNHDLQQQIKLQADAAAAHRRLAPAQAELVNVTYGKPELRARLESEAKRMSAAYGVPQDVVMRSLSHVVGKGQGMPIEKIVAGHELAVQLGRHNPDQIDPVSTAITQVMRISGLGHKEAAALIQSASSEAFVSDPVLQSRFLYQGLSGMAANIPGGGQAAAEQSLEYLAYISKAVGEERGEAGRTAGIAAAAQFDEFREGRGKWASHLFGRTRNNPVKGMPALPLDAIKWFQQNPEQAKRFLEKATLEQLFEGPFRRLIQGDPEQKKLLEQTVAGISTDTKPLDEQVKAIAEGTPQMKQNTLDAQGKAVIEQYQSNFARGAVTDSLRGMRDQAAAASAKFRRADFLQRLGTQQVVDLSTWATGNRAEGFAFQIKMMKRELELERGPTGRLRERTTAMSGEERDVYDLLKQLLANAEKQLVEMRLRNRPQPVAAGAQGERGGQREK